jgi:two-component system KDP operon response regulator KdpE
MSSVTPRILVIDDEPTIRGMLRRQLELNKFEVHEAENSAQGLEAASSAHPHLIILDLGLPDASGLQTLQKLREWTSIPVIILTVTDDEKTKVELLDAGADDYLTKPFGLPELLARVRVSLRRHSFQEATPVFKSGDLEVDLNDRSVKLKGQTVKLTATEFSLLTRLVRENGKVVSQMQLLQEVWGPHSLEQQHYLRIYIGALRKKIERDPTKPDHIITESGVGYKII